MYGLINACHAHFVNFTTCTYRMVLQVDVNAMVQQCLHAALNTRCQVKWSITLQQVSIC